MAEVVFSRGMGGRAEVIRDDGGLVLRIGAGADRYHDPFTFTFAITSEHLDALRADAARHLLLDHVLRQVCERTGGQRTPNKKKARRIVDRILLAPEAEVESWFQPDADDIRALIGYGADPDLLRKGHVLAALRQ